MPTQEEVAEYWYCRDLPGSDYIPLTSLTNPKCFACGWFLIHEVKTKEVEENPWEGLRLAHVVPRNLGGSNSVWNIVILCEACQKQSPKTAYADRFWNWIIDHPDSDLREHDLLSDKPADVDAFAYKELHRKGINALSLLDPEDLEFLLELQDRKAFSDLLHLMQSAQERIGGIFLGQGMSLSSRDLAKILQEMIRHERTNRD